MESFSMQNERKIRLKGFKALAVELIVIVLLILMLLLLLNYLKIIKFSSFFPSQNAGQSESIPAVSHSSNASITPASQVPKNKIPISPSVIAGRDLLVGVRNALISSVFIDEYQGVVKTVDRNAGFIKIGKANFRYDSKIVLQGAKGDATFLLNKEYLKIVKTTKATTGDQETPINLDDINIGDNIKIRVTLDQTTTPNKITEILITKI